MNTANTGMELLASINPQEAERLLDLIKQELISFFDTMKSEKWFGKEREMVSRFVFSNIMRLIKTDTIFYSPNQIGIEVRIKPSEKSRKIKPEVNKDLVIWQSPNKTAFTDPYETPLLIMEWKWQNNGLYEDDIDWLKKYVEDYPVTIGIAVNIDNKDKYTMQAALIRHESPINRQWINTKNSLVKHK